MSSSLNDDFNDYLFQIVEFIKKGRSSTRTIDIVPMKWVSFDKKRGCLEVKFKPPPYTNEDFDEIRKLVESNVHAPQEWLSYKVKVVARAKSYVEVLKKLKLAQDTRFAFTTDSDV